MSQINSQENDTEGLLRRVTEGDQQAVNDLMERYRDRVRQMVKLRLDPRLAVRVDPSDVVQETMVEAATGLERFARERPTHFYPWIRGIAWQKLMREHRRHVQAQNRSVDREERVELYLSEESQVTLAGRFTGNQPTPSGDVMRTERKHRVNLALAKLAEPDREVLILRYLEQMSIREIAETMGIREDAARQRHSRALTRFQRLISSEDEP